MNIICHRELLLSASSLLTHVIPQKTQARPILSNIDCRVENDQLKLTGTDLEMGLHVTIPLMKTYEAGQVLLPAWQLLNILKETTEESIHMEALEKTAIISGQAFQYKLPSFSNEEFPEVPNLEGDEIKLKTAGLKRLINEVSFAMNKDKSRYSLNSLLICLHGSVMEGVATDQIRLAYSSSDLGEAVEGEERYIFPAKSVMILQAILDDHDEEDITLVKGKNQITIKFKNGFFITRLVDAQFPNYRNAYENFKDVPDITLNTQVFSKAIRQILLLTCENARNIGVILNKNKMILRASTPLGEGKVELDVEYEGEEMAIGMNPYFVQDFLKEVNSQNLETVRLKIAGSKKPVILSPHDQYLYFMSPTAA